MAQRNPYDGPHNGLDCTACVRTYPEREACGHLLVPYNRLGGHCRGKRDQAIVHWLVPRRRGLPDGEYQDAFDPRRFKGILLLYGCGDVWSFNGSGGAYFMGFSFGPIYEMEADNALFN